MESKNIEIVGYEPKYQKIFKELNEEWIAAHFKMEQADYKALDDPEGYILSKGGHIFVASFQEVPIIYNDRPF